MPTRTTKGHSYDLSQFKSDEGYIYVEQDGRYEEFTYTAERFHNAEQARAQVLQKAVELPMGVVGRVSAPTKAVCCAHYVREHGHEKESGPRLAGHMTVLEEPGELLEKAGKVVDAFLPITHYFTTDVHVTLYEEQRVQVHDIRWYDEPGYGQVSFESGSYFTKHSGRQLREAFVHFFNDAADRAPNNTNGDEYLRGVYEDINYWLEKYDVPLIRSPWFEDEVEGEYPYVKSLRERKDSVDTDDS